MVELNKANTVFYREKGCILLSQLSYLSLIVKRNYLAIILSVPISTEWDAFRSEGTRKLENRGPEIS
jgi:hypothetical protein